MKLMIPITIFISLLIGSTFQAKVASSKSTTVTAKEVCESSAKYIKDKCVNFSSIKSLALFNEFYDNFNNLNSCLRNKTVTTESQLAEETCEQKGILFASVQAIGELINRFKALKPICTIEYVGKIYRLHNQLNQMSSSDNDESSSFDLRNVLRSLANRVAVRCRQSLAKRLLNVEKRAPDSIKYNTVINGILNIGSGKVEKLDVEVERFVPILQSELIPDNENSIGKSAGGYEFKMTQQIKLALDSIKMSCKALQIYHVNILGSLGLLASIGYAASPEEVKSLRDEPIDVSGPIRRWLVPAVICQTLRGALKMSEFTTEGKNLSRLKIVQLQEADVNEKLENNSEFETFRLPEMKTPIDLTLEGLPSDTYVYSNTKQVNLRKLQLLEGPNYRLANAIYTYLDLTQRNDIKKRTKIPFEMLGMKAPVEESNNDDDDDEDDDEEE